MNREQMEEFIRTAPERLDARYKRLCQIPAVREAMRQRPAPPIDAEDLNSAVAEFKRMLPGWWWSIGECHLSYDAYCGPDYSGPDADLSKLDEFANGFGCEGDVSIVDSLRVVMEQGLAARTRARGPTGAPPSP